MQGQGLPAAGDLGAEALGYVYDELQRPVGVNTSLSGGSYVTDVSYSPTSDVEQVELYTGVSSTPKTWITNTYETGTDRLTNSSVTVEGGSARAYDANYTYDAAGNILSIADTPTGGASDVQCFAYDGLKQLTESWTSSVTSNDASGTGSTDAACASGASTSTVGGTSPYWTEYGYDSTGNRTSEVRHGLNGAATSSRTYAYGESDSGPHTVSSVTEETEATGTTPEVTSKDTYTYNESGGTKTRVLDGDTQTLDWDKQGELTTVTNADGSVTSYKYDASGERILRNTPTEKTYYLPGMELKYDKSTSKVTTTRYYSFGGTTVAMRESDGVHFLASDHQGTAELAVNATTGATQRRRTDAFGNERDESTSSSSGWVNDKGFVGGTVQESTGLTTLGAREYDSDTGRFLSADPIVDFTDPQQINGYAYSNNSPVTSSDPTGLWCDSCNDGKGWPKVGGYEDDQADQSNSGSGGGGGGGGSSDTAAQDEADEARAQENEAKQRAMAIAKELGAIIADELGITDALDCFTTGNLGACGNTAVNVVSSLISGGPLGRLALKYGFRVDKAAAVGKRIIGLGQKLWSDFKKWRKSEKAAKKAEEAAEECNSFTPDTRVLMADGTTKAIEDVDIGDKVLATDPETGETKPETVTAEIKGQGLKRLVRVTIDVDGNKGDKTATVTATQGHPFWVPELDEWIDATDLEAGAWLRTSTDTRIQITAIERWTALSATVHNLTVRELHTYYVLAGETAVLVHNSTCPIGFTADAVSDAFTGMNKGGGHAMRHLIKDGLIPNKGSVASQAEYFEKNFSGVLTSPQNTFDWKIGGTQARGFSARVDGRVVVLFVAKEGPYQGKVLSSMVPGARNMTKWGLW